MEPEQLPEGCRGGAEAVLNLLPGSSISIAYHPLFGPHNDLMLLELDENLLSEVLHQRVILRGEPDEDAVFCTESKTYTIKFVGTSNSVFLIPPSALCEYSQNSGERKQGRPVTASVIKVAPGNMELIEVAPRLEKLKLLLSENPFKLNETEVERRGVNKLGLFTWDDLVDRIQASDNELRAGLEALSAVEIGGYWRTVDEGCMDTILNALLQSAILNDWSINALNEDEVLSVLVSDDFPPELAFHCLKVYGNKSSVWSLDENRVCVHFSRGVLRGGKMRVEKFMEQWMQKVPDGMHPRFNMLEGEVLTERFGVEMWIRGFSAASLPSTPAERFAALFRERPRWEWRDLQPYIRDLRVPGLSSEALLLKYTRKTQPTLDSEPIFSAR